MKDDVPFDDIVSHFTSMEGDGVRMNPGMVAGKDHVLSAARHAERAFSKGTNRSTTLLSEIILYATWERLISKPALLIR